MIEIEIVGKILLGPGLMFTGVQMLSLGLKQLGSRQFRKLATQFVSSRGKAHLAPQSSAKSHAHLLFRAAI
jgi:hypothetical protein